MMRMLLQKDHVLPAEFTNRLAISLRTVRMDIRSLNEYYKAVYEHSGDTLIRSSPTRGYYIRPSDQAGARYCLEQLIQDARTQSYPETANERFLFLLLHLSFLDQPTATRDLAEIMYASKTSVTQSLKEIAHYLAGFDHIQLQTSLKGIQLVGSERMKRHVIAATLNYYTFGSILMDKALRFIFGESYVQLYTWLQSYLPQLLERHQYDLIDKSAEGFLLDTFITIKREEKGYTLEPQSLPSAAWTAELMQALADRKTELSPVGAAFLQECLGAKRVIYREPTPNPAAAESLRFTQQFLQMVDRNYGTSYTSDAALYTRLSMHNESMLNRIRQGHFEHNPILEQVKEQYPRQMEMAALCSHFLPDNGPSSLNEHEISYIALYFASFARQTKKAILICDLGESVAHHMIRQIYKSCGERLEITKRTSLSHLRQNVPETDMIITVSRIFDVQLPEHIQVVYVNYILNDEDIRRIQQLL
ncbi:BglG family transcription antiterminator [Paenibacillus kandeliae]|uniref:BglG family transcription antiterminator n=1 Tax=Paenibacillus kandeliae TaxID=3231269 RepID=UPI0034589F35